jgi:hypothetical protein
MTSQLENMHFGSVAAFQTASGVKVVIAPPPSPQKTDNHMQMQLNTTHPLSISKRFDLSPGLIL